MPTSSSARRPQSMNRLIALVVVIAALYGLMALSKTWTPRLGLDLRGGTTITLTARPNPDGTQPNQANLEMARSIIQKRVDALGVGESSVTLQGQNQIEVAVPNVSNDELVRLVGTTAALAFRNVYAIDYGSPQPSTSPSNSASAGASGQPSVNPSAADSAAATSQPASGTTSTTTQPTSQPTSAASTAQGRPAPGLPTAPPPTPTPRPTTPAPTPPTIDDVLAWQPSDQDYAEFGTYKCGDPFPDVSDQPLFACSTDKQYKYLLGPTVISGQRVTDAQALIPQGQVAWIVTLKFDDVGAQQFAQATTHLSTQQQPLNQFAIVLDGQVIEAPQVNNPITGGSAEISGGGITESSARELANVLKFGALPVSFDVSSVDTISPTLGGEQLRAGIIAGLIGLALVVIYSFVYYRGLGLVVVGSLAVSVLTTWAVLVLLGTTVGFALNLPGVAGAIVAIGVTADSFIVYFERIRDEIRDGYSLTHSTESGWRKARGTIVMADSVQLLAAVVLFILAVGAVRGFAFTLGVTTAIDLFIVFFFTHPLVQLLGRTRFFGQGHRWSGFDPEHLGVSRASLLGQRGSRVRAGANQRRHSRPADSRVAATSGEEAR